MPLDFGASRRSFLSTTLAGAAAPMLQPVLAARRAEADPFGALISVHDFGAAGDGETDDREAFQRAIDYLHQRGGGTLYVPAVDVAAGRYYRLTLPFFLRSFVTLEGDGPASLIYNDRASSVIFGDSFVVIPGTYHPAFTMKLAFFPCAPTQSGDARIVLAGDGIDNFEPGMTVTLRGPIHSTTYDGFDDLFWQRLNEIEAVDRSTHSLELRYPLDAQAPHNLQIAKTDTAAVRYMPRPAGVAGAPMFVSKRSALRRLGLRSNGPVMGDSATFECVFEDLSIKGYRGIYGNLFAHSIWRRIDLDVSIQALEASQNSHDTTFQALSVRVRRWGGENYPLLAFNESPSRLLLDGFRIFAGPWAAQSPVLRIGHNAQGCVMRDGVVDAPNAGGAIVAMDVPRAPQEGPKWRTSNCGFENITSSQATTGGNALLCETDEPEHLENCWFRGLRFEGHFRRAGRIAGRRTVVENCAWFAKDAQLQLMPNASECRVVSCDVPLGVQLLTPDALNRNVISSISSTTSTELRRLVNRRSTNSKFYGAKTELEIVERIDIPGGVLAPGDIIRFQISGHVMPAMGERRISLVVGQNELTPIVWKGVGAAAFSLSGYLKVMNPNAILMQTNISGGDTGASVDVVALTVPNLDMQPIAIELRAQTSRPGTAAIAVENILIRPERDGYVT